MTSVKKRRLSSGLGESSSTCARWAISNERIVGFKGGPGKLTRQQSAFVGRNLDAALPEALVVLFARVLHHFPVGPQRERSRVRPRFGIGLRIVDGDLVDDVPEVG